MGKMEPKTPTYSCEEMILENRISDQPGGRLREFIRGGYIELKEFYPDAERQLVRQEVEDYGVDDLSERRALSALISSGVAFGESACLS